MLTVYGKHCKEESMWYKIIKEQVCVMIIAKPNAKKSACIKIDAQGLHIALHAKPVQGAANKELINFLAKLFAVPKSQLILLKGETSRYKQISLPYNAKVNARLMELSRCMEK